MTPEEQQVWSRFGVLGLAGFLAGIGVLLASRETLTIRIVIGRALSSVMLGIGAASALTFFPALAFEAQIGIACLTASLGTSGLERIIQAVRGGR